MKKCLIIANGDTPDASILNILKDKGYYFIICADGGANMAYEFNITPNLIIGDLDSIESEVLKFYKDKSEIIKLTRQNDTDVEKALSWAVDNYFTDVLLLGVFGERLDHTLGNLSIAAKFYRYLNIIMFGNESIMYVVNRSAKFTSSPGEVISLFSFDDKTIVNSYGLKYPLIDMTLKFGEQESISNVAESKEFGLLIENGFIFLIRNLKFVIEHGLI